MKILVTSFLSWHMDNAAKSYDNKNVLYGLYVGNSNSKKVSQDKYRRCWQFAIPMHPIYLHLGRQYEFWQYNVFVKLFDKWLSLQEIKDVDVVQAIAWGAKAPFDVAEKIGALKVIDMPNSYPTTYDSIERREMALWGRVVKPAIPSHIIEQSARDIERADVVLCPSDWVKDSMLTNGVPESKLFLNHFGVDTETFKVRQHIPPTPRFIIVGSVRLRKGHQYLIAAFSNLLRRYSEAELIIVGSVHDDYSHLWVENLPQVSHYKSLTHAQISELFQSCTAFILPSLEEGFARVLVEAMASGLPIIATYESGATTLVEDGCEGFIVKGRNVCALENAMAYIIEHPEKNLEMGVKSALKGRVKNSWQDYGDRNIEIFRSRLVK